VSTTQGFYLPEGLTIPVPEPDGLSAPYWQGLREERLVVQRCARCRGWQWGPEWICSKCSSFDLQWEHVEGKGNLYSWTRVYHPVNDVLKNHGPYLLAVVELPHAGGIRMLGNLLGDPMQEPAFDAPVQVIFEHHPDASPPYSLAHWRLAGG
jgi:uncharacterized OB-fold protein